MANLGILIVLTVLWSYTGILKILHFEGAHCDTRVLIWNLKSSYLLKAVPQGADCCPLLFEENVVLNFKKMSFISFLLI